MSNDRERADAENALIRISVTGSGRRYQVKNGHDAPATVWAGEEGLSCDCGMDDCWHVVSLRLCGFVDAQRPESARPPQAA